MALGFDNLGVAELAVIARKFIAVFNCKGRSGFGVSSASIEAETEGRLICDASIITPAIPKLGIMEINSAIVSRNRGKAR